MRKVNLPEDIESPNDAFFSHQLVDLIVNQAATQKTVNWHGISISRPESLYNLLREMTDTIIVKGGKGYFWLVMPPSINELFEINFPKKYVSVPMDQLPLGYNCVLYTGTFDKRWRMYIDPLLTNSIIIGATFSKKNPNFYGVLKLDNYGIPLEEVVDEATRAKSLMDGFFPDE